MGNSLIVIHYGLLVEQVVEPEERARMRDVPYLEREEVVRCEVVLLRDLKKDGLVNKKLQNSYVNCKGEGTYVYLPFVLIIGKLLSVDH